MQRFKPTDVQPAELDLDDVALTTLLNAKDHINEMTAKTIPIASPSGGFEMISPLEHAQRNNDQKQLDLFFLQAEKLYKRDKGVLDVKYVDDVKHGRTILFWAIATFRNAEYIALLLQKNKNFATEVYRDDKLDTFYPIFYAIFINNSTALKVLLNENPDLIIQESECARTPAHYAAELRRINILEILQTYNRKIARIRTRPELTPLHFIIAADDTNDENTTVVKWLLEHDDHSDDELTLCDIGDNNKVTPLHQAILLGRPKTVCLLLQHGADTRLATGQHATPPNKTPLQLAADTGNNAIMRILLLHGARPEARPEAGKESPHPINPSKLSKRLQIVLAVLEYRDDRGRQPKHKTTFLGMSNVKILSVAGYKNYTRAEKRNAVDALVEAILNDHNDENDPLNNLSQDILGALSQGELGEIVRPLLDEHNRLRLDKNSPTSTPRLSPSPNGKGNE